MVCHAITRASIILDTAYTYPGCRLCEKRCSQGISIASRLKEAHEAMKSSGDQL
jgi:predicted aldo/keto reductase-like oxidoreductase